ncbi:50S ribosomal protein L4 [Anaerolineae bacterium CFX9]|jgi:large subunit ribosomal protein L4|nr:50S ribosomal protein L4 [Anaerolineae bacterium CFX9]
MQVPVMNMSGKQVSTIDLPADIFEARINVGLMHQAYVRQMANARLGTHKVKRRSEVSRTTAKMYKQKGTGRARHGSRSATQFVGGGRPMGPQPRDYTLDMPKKMRRGAIRSALSALAADGQLVFVDQFTLDAPKTKDAAKALQALVGEASALVLINASGDENVQRSVNNLEAAKTLRANYLNIRDLLQYDKVVVPLSALEVIKSIWGTAAE